MIESRLVLTLTGSVYQVAVDLLVQHHERPPLHSSLCEYGVLS